MSTYGDVLRARTGGCIKMMIIGLICGLFLGWWFLPQPAWAGKLKIFLATKAKEVFKKKDDLG
jgi:hypothetical protein